MVELAELENDPNGEEVKVGSLNHGIAQANLTTLFSHDERFRVITELSLDVSQIDLNQFGLKVKDELIPDVCLYPKEQRLIQGDDILKMSQMPILIIEILSPKQALGDILSKFKAYFALGIKSCWLVIPVNESITVYSKPHEFVSFGSRETEIIDEVMNVRLPLHKVFAW